MGSLSNRKDRATVPLHFLDLFRRDGTTYGLTAGRVGRQRDERRWDSGSCLAGILGSHCLKVCEP